MDNLRILRDRANEHYRVEIEVLRAMTVIESLYIWVRLQNAYAWQLEQTALLFGNDHRENLIDIQARIHKLIE
jgi:hypothetical protein